MRKTLYLKNYSDSIDLELSKAKDEFRLQLGLENDGERTITFSVTFPFLFNLYLNLNLWSVCGGIKFYY